MSGITQNGQKRLVFIVVPELRNADGSEFVKTKNINNRQTSKQTNKQTNKLTATKTAIAKKTRGKIKVVLLTYCLQ